MNERKIFQGALEYSDPDQRRAYLDQACGKDPALRARIEALLLSHDSASQFLNVPALEQINPRNEGRPFQTVDFPQTGGAKAAAGDDDIPENEALATPDLSFLSPSSKPGSLGVLGHYEILNLLGQGAFGLVFRAFDEKLHRQVAIKVMNPQLAATSPPRKRFLREARSAAAIKHENIVQVYSVEEQPLPYMVMEYVDGQTLQSKLNRSGPLDVADILHLGRQMANGLAAAHAQGLIHRDIKPGNILIEAGTEQKVKITDFGLARAADDATMTRTGVISGTPMYMAPEQAHGLALDHRADLFSLGSVLYQMACGRPPFRGANAIAVLKRVTDEEPRPIQEILPQAPDWLCAIIAKLQAKKPEERFQSAKEVADLITRCQADLQNKDRVELPGDILAFLPRPAGESRSEPVFPNPARENPVARPTAHRRWVAAAAVLVALLGGMSLTEATGVTNFGGTVVRLLSPDGTLVVELDDPGVSVSIDGEEMVITGAGAKEIRLKPGQYKVLASKDGRVVSQELVTVTKNGRQVVRVRREAVNQSIPQTIEKIDRRPQFRIGGEWRIEGNELVQASPNNAAILFGDRNWTDYDFEVELNSQGKTKDGHGAGVLYRATDMANFFDFQIGGWSATVSEVTFLKKQQWGRVPGTFLHVPHEHNRWYKAKVEVRGAKMRCSVDGKDLFVFEDADHPKGMVGLSNGNSPVRWRNLKVTAPDGRVLWEGFPEFDAAASKAAMPPPILAVGPALADTRPPLQVDRRPRVQSGGEWRIEGNELVQALPQGSFLMFGDPGWTDYIVEVEGLTSSTTKEVHGLRTIFRAQNPDNHRMFDIGNYAGTITDACYFKQGKWGRTPGCLLRTPFEKDRWYKIKVEVNGPAVRCSVDGKLTFAYSDDDLPTGMIGLASGGSLTRWRNLKVTAPDGRVLWEGFPEFDVASKTALPPPDLAAAPFDEQKAKQYQAEWAKYLNRKVVEENSLGMKLTLIPPAQFQMGANEVEKDGAIDFKIDPAEKPQHSVTLTRPFLLSATEVTQEQFAKIMARNLSGHNAKGQRAEQVIEVDSKHLPVEMVSWFDAIEFCNRLSEKEGLPPYYELTFPVRYKDGGISAADVKVLGGIGYRLPTEAEWEYACRAGTTTPFSFPFDYGTLGQYGWFGYIDRTHAVAERKPNPFGLHDMHGNVHEWCFDWFGPYAGDSLRDPTGPSTATERVCRGGAYNYLPPYARSAWRGKVRPSARLDNTGLRVARFVAERASKASHTEH